MNKNKQRIKLISMIGIMSIIICSIVATVVYATDFGSELISISDNVGATTQGTTINVKTDQNAWGTMITGSGVVAELNGQYNDSTDGPTAENLEISPGSGILNKYSNAYCARRHTGMSSAPGPTFSTQHNGGINANDYIIFDESSSAPTRNAEEILDFLQKGENFSQTTASNFNAIVYWSGDLRHITSPFGKLIDNTNIIAYAHVYSDKAPGMYYNTTDAQNSIWGVMGDYPDYYPDTFRAGKAVDDLENEIYTKGHGKEIKVTVEDSEHPGTVWLESEKTYRVGPFHMEDYAYVYSEYVKPYSGSGNEMNIPGTSIGSGLVGGIDGGSITLKDDDGNLVTREFFTDVIENGVTKSGPKIVFEDFYGNPTYKGDYTRHNTNNYTVPIPENEVVYPFPDAVFYIDIPRDISEDTTTLSDITFSYRETKTNGSGSVTVARYAKTTWTTNEISNSSCSYASDCHGDTATGGSDSARNCTYDCDNDDCEDCPHTHSVWFYCSHRHTYCKNAKWDGAPVLTYGQPLLIIESAQVIVESTPYTTPVNIRLTTKISIKKYAKEIKHATNGEVTFGDNVDTTELTTSQTPDDRKKMSDSDKQNDPVYAEYGDIIKYRIDIKNDQKYEVKVQLKDILPDKIKLIKRTFKDYEWLTIPGEKEVAYELILITEANDDNLYVNEVKLVTKNIDLKKDDDENTDFIRTTDSREGPVVNLNEIDSPEDIVSKEYHKINDYDLDIDKYITDYNHAMMDENNRNVITDEDYDVSALNNNGRLDQRIERKKNYPVPVEKTEQFTYSIRMTNNSVKTGTNKVATKVRPTQIIDTLNKGLKYVGIQGFIYDSSGKVKYTLTNGTDFSITEDNITKNKFYIKLNNMQGNDYLVIEPNEYLIYEMTVEVIESNMRLEILENVVNISILSNINNGTTTENISKSVGFTITNPICSTCGGHKVEIYYEKCTNCNGAGVTSNNENCKRCGGTGKVKVTHNCDRCGGTGLIETNCNHVGTDRFYECDTCHRRVALQGGATLPASSKCANSSGKSCGSTSFTEKCNICGRLKGSCTHYVYYCSGNNKHSHTEIEIGRGKNAPSRCRYKFTCDEYHETDNISTLYVCGNNHEQWDNSGSCVTCGNAVAVSNTAGKKCNYCGLRFDKSLNSCPKYKYTYKCPSCTYTSGSSGKCATHTNTNLVFSKKECVKHSKSLGQNATCNVKIRCTQTNFAKKCYAGGEHSPSNCNHFDYVCDVCGKKYNNKPASCNKKVTQNCTGTLKPIGSGSGCADCGGTGKKKVACTSCKDKHGTGNGEKKVEVTCPSCNGNKTVGITNLCSPCYSTGHIQKTRSCTHCSGTGIDGDFKSERIVRKADGSLNRNLAKNKDDDGDGTNEQSSEYVRMKDLVISGYVWLDMNRDGLMNTEDQGFLTDQTKEYYNIGNDTKEAGKQSVVVNLYSVIGDQETLVRTTQTDNRGRYTFSNYYDGSSLQWYNDYKSSCWEEYNNKNKEGDKRPYERLCNNSPSTTPQRIDKATNKDDYGNYTDQSQYIQYYIEFEYDGIVYKSTEFYSGMDNLITDNTKDTYGRMIDPDKIYMKDSNAAEFTDIRENFNKKYEYISYDIAYNDQKTAEANSRLDFDKTQHTSQLMENPLRIITSRSFIKLKTMNGVGTDTTKKDLADTNTLWLFNHDDYTKKGTNHETPDTEYLKYINLGLELREDVDITLTKDVYSTKTLINGEEMEYFFNQNNTLNGDTVANAEGLYLNDFIIKTPYGLDLYESDYKMRVDQYASDAVKAYKGLNGESELNTEITYRITVANKAINDDESIKVSNTTDTKLKVKVSEILDLYDTNFIKYNSDADVVNVKTKDPNGYLIDNTIKVAEAWYFIPDSAGDYIVADGVFTSKYADEKGNQIKKPVFVKADSTDVQNATRYKKVNLTLKNTSSLGAGGNSEKENENNFLSDGYYTLYITGMENLTIAEGENFDIYVKYVLDKSDDVKTEITTDDYEDTINDTATTTDGAIVNIEGTTRGSSTTLKRTLKILDKIAKNADTARGLEGIAQVNLYSVWYEDGKPASLVDMDANAGNIGNVDSNLQTKLQGKTDNTERLKILENSKLEKKDKANHASADAWNPYYEDMTYKTGIQITADGSEWTKEEAKKLHGEIELQSEKMIRELTGRVWDDSRTEPGESENPTANDVQYMANGIYSKKDEKHNRALTNGNVPEEYKNPDAIEGQKTEVVEETKDLKVRSAKAELVEIVEIPTSEGSHYYEEILSNVTWEQAQHIRTNTKGDYKLKGFIPGKYVVRFTYGDTVDEVTSEEVRFITGKGQDTAISQDEKESTATSVAKDMQIFNGQDYKTTKYAYDLSSDYTTDSISVDSPAGTDPVANLAVKTGTIDQYAAGKLSESGEVSNNDIVMLALERPDLSDARDDEVRRLEVNSYSEIMVNQKAEILKGLANSSDLTTRTLKYQDEKDDDALKVNYYKEYEEEQYRNDYAQSLRSLTDSTNMNAETVEFLVKPEKLTYKQTNEETYYTKLKLNNKDYYYNDLDTIVHNIITERKYKIENIDMGIEYRPETNISLTKEISNIIVETSDGEQIANLALETEYKQEGNIMKPIHRVDMEHSIGADKVQFISNTYEVDPLLANIVDVHEETQQGFIYIAVDEEILQGCKVTVQYKFIAQNNSEVDKISQNLNSIRFYANNATKAYAEKYATIATGDSVSDYGNNSNGKISLYKIFDKYGVDTQKVEYTANNFARAIVQDDVYKKDANNSTYRNRAKTMTKDSVNKKDQITDGYYGNFVGYTYYIGRDNYTLDTIAEMKFDKIIDYVDTDLEFEQLLQYDKSTMTSTSTSTENTSGLSNALTNEQAIKDNKATINQSWSAPVAEAFAKIDNDPKVLVQIMNDMREDLFMLDSPWSLFRNFIGQYDKEDIEAAIKDVVSNPLKQAMLVDALQETFTDMNGIQYKSLVMTLADKVSDNAEDENKNSNKAFSKFLLPRTVAEKNGKQSEDKDTSKAIVYLPVSKVLATETDTENMLYENIAEVIQFTVLTGRRTNFDTTIGNADIHKVDKQSKNPEEYNLGKKPVDYEKFGSIEFVTAALEKDTSSTETITLTPPTGLMKNRRAIYETMETTRDVLKITVIAVTVVIITIGVTKFTMVKIKKRRYK